MERNRRNRSEGKEKGRVGRWRGGREEVEREGERGERGGERGRGERGREREGREKGEERGDRERRLSIK